MKNTILPLLLFAMACSQDKQQPDFLQACEPSDFNTVIKEFIPATVKLVGEGQFYFQGNKEYIEINVARYNPILFKREEDSIVRVFAPTEDLKNRVGSEITVKGAITTCITGDHGLLININTSFYVFEDITLTNN